MPNNIEPPEYPHTWSSQPQHPPVRDEDAGRYVLADIKAILDEKFKAGEGVVTIGPDTPDEMILRTIKHAVSFGMPFKVHPPVETFIKE